MLALCLWSLFEAICWVQAPGRFPRGGPVTEAGQCRKHHRPGDRYTRPAGWQSIKALQPARSLYMLQGTLICKRCCLLSGPRRAAAVFVPLLRGCFQCSLFAIYVSLCRTAVWSLDKMPRMPLETFSFPLKAASLVWKTTQKIFFFFIRSQFLFLKSLNYKFIFSRGIGASLKMPLKTYQSIIHTVRIGNSFSLTTGIKLETNHKGVSVIIATVFPSHATVIVAFHRDTVLSLHRSNTLWSECIQSGCVWLCMCVCWHLMSLFWVMDLSLVERGAGPEAVLWGPWVKEAALAHC